MSAFFLQFQPQQPVMSIPVHLSAMFDLEPMVDDRVFDSSSLFSSTASDVTDDHSTITVGGSISTPSSSYPDPDCSPPLSQMISGASPPLKRQKAVLFVSV